MTDNNSEKVRAHWGLKGTCVFDLPQDQWPQDIEVLAYPDDPATRQLVFAACGRWPISVPTGEFIPASVMLGHHHSARRAHGLARQWGRLTQGRQAKIRFGAPTDRPDRPRELYYQGVPPARDRLSDIQRRVLAEPSLASEQDRPRIAGLIREIAARPNPGLTGLFDRILSAFWSRFYQGIQLTGLTDARHDLGDRVPVYLVTHRSHLDYLLISWLLHRAGLTPPVIAAGINLNLPGVGRLLRAGGAFFIRRQFAGDPLYQTTVSAYLSSLIRRRQPLLIFPEGGRSRNGQCRGLKLGLMRDVIQATEHTKVAVVPVALAYDRMPDGRGYRQELEGQTKKKEGLRDLPKAWKTLRSEPLGQVYVAFGRPFDLSPDMALTALDQQILSQWQRIMPTGPVAKLGLLLPGFTGHRARRSELQRAIDILDDACGLAPIPTTIEQGQALGYLVQTGADPMIHAPAQGRDQLGYAAGSLKHRAIALGLLAIGRLSQTRTRRTRSLFDLAWPTLSLSLHIPDDYQAELAQAEAALKRAGLSEVADNQDYRLLAALAEPVVADVTIILCTLKACLDPTLNDTDGRIAQAKDRASNAMLLSGRSELAVLDPQPYLRFLQQLESAGALAEGKLSRGMARATERWCEKFALVDRQFVI